MQKKLAFILRVFFCNGHYPTFFEYMPPHATQLLQRCDMVYNHFPFSPLPPLPDYIYWASSTSCSPLGSGYHHPLTPIRHPTPRYKKEGKGEQEKNGENVWYVHRGKEWFFSSDLFFFLCILIEYYMYMCVCAQLSTDTDTRQVQREFHLVNNQVLWNQIHRGPPKFFNTCQLIYIQFFSSKWWTLSISNCEQKKKDLFINLHRNLVKINLIKF